MEKKVKEAKNILLTLFGLLILMDIGSNIVKYASPLGNIPEVIRLGITIGLMFFTYKGFAWAKGLIAIFYLLGAILCLFFILTLLGSGKIGWIPILWILLFLLISALSGFSGLYILLSKNLQKFFKSQRNII